MAEKRSFQLYISAANCKYEVRLNDFPVFKDHKGHQLHLAYPVNQLMFGNLATIACRIEPIDGQLELDQTPDFSVELRYGDLPARRFEVLYRYEYRYAGTPRPQILELKELPVPDLGLGPVWNNGDVLSISDGLLSDLYHQYRRVWNAFRARKMGELRELFFERERAYARAFHEAEEARLNASMRTYESYLSEANNRLYDLHLQHFTPRLACFGKVIYMDEKDGFHPIFFLKKHPRGSINIPIYFSRIENRLIITL